MDQISDAAKSEFEALADQHPSVESFLDEVKRFGEMVWHNMRRGKSDEGVKSTPAQDNSPAVAEPAPAS
jgi:hypothetical protein